MVAPAWFRLRTYLHFDPPVGARAAEDYVAVPSNISVHSFYPFIKYTVASHKVAKMKPFGPVVKKVKERPIAYAAHMDSHIYAYYCSLLTELYEQKLSESYLSESVLAFRALGKSNIHFANDAFNEIRARGECTALAFDVTGFFDNLDHRLLKAAWAELVGGKLSDDHFRVFKSITRFSWVEKEALYEKLGISLNNPKVKNRRLCPPEQFRNNVRGAKLVCRNSAGKGIPQGSPISAILSNIYMLSFDREMLFFLAGLEATYFRYCDDILIICNLGDGNAIYDFVDVALKKLKLELQHKKTEVREFRRVAGVLHSDKPLQYLGFIFDGVREYIRSASFTRYHQKLKKKVRLARQSMVRINKLRAARDEPPRELFLKSIHRGYSYLGRRNFVSYGHRAARIMASKSIKKQLRSHWGKIKKLTEPDQ